MAKDTKLTINLCCRETKSKTSYLLKTRTMIYLGCTAETKTTINLHLQVSQMLNVQYLFPSWHPAPWQKNKRKEEQQ